MGSSLQNSSRGTGVKWAGSELPDPDAHRGLEIWAPDLSSEIVYSYALELIHK